MRCELCEGEFCPHTAITFRWSARAEVRILSSETARVHHFCSTGCRDAWKAGELLKCMDEPERLVEEQVAKELRDFLDPIFGSFIHAKNIPATHKAMEQCIAVQMQELVDDGRIESFKVEHARNPMKAAVEFHVKVTLKQPLASVTICTEISDHALKC